MSGRRLGATVIGLLAGGAGFALLLLVGYLLYLRLWGDSPLALGVIIFLFGMPGVYAGWILGMLVFSAVRGAGNGGGEAV